MSNIIKVNFSGASSTGKSTITRYCADVYGEPGSLETMPAYLVENKMRIEDIKNETFLICSKMHEEDIVAKQKLAKKYLFIDSGPLIFYLGNRYSFGREFPKLKDMALEFYKKQDCVFVCDNNIQFDTVQMRGDEGTKDILHGEVISFLNEHDIEFTMLVGSVEERARTVCNTLNNLDKAKQDKIEQMKEANIILPLQVLGMAYLETNALWSRKERAIENIIHTNEFLLKNSQEGIREYPDVKLAKSLYELRKNGVLLKDWEIAKMSLFKQSDLFKCSDGLGFERDLTSTFKSQREIKLFNDFERD